MPEKNLNEIVRDARVLFTRGTEALAHDNFDYAITLLNQVLEKEPGFFDCRKTLRDAQFRKAGDGGSGLFKRMWSNTGNSPQIMKAKMALGKNPAEAMAIAEADFERRPEQFRRPPHHRGRRQRAGAAAHGCDVLRNTREKFAQGQEPGH